MASVAYAAWAEPVEAVAKHHGTSLKTGLSAPQVAAAREAHGFNELPPEESKSMWALVLEQFDDNLVKVRVRFILLTHPFAPYAPRTRPSLIASILHDEGGDGAMHEWTRIVAGRLRMTRVCSS